jgi:hypothetical protein
MNELLRYIYALPVDETFVAILAIVISVLSIGISITMIVLTKKTVERDNARIAREEAATQE